MKILTTLFFETNAKDLAVKLATISGLANDRTEPSNEQNLYICFHGCSSRNESDSPSGHYKSEVLAQRSSVCSGFSPATVHMALDIGTRPTPSTACNSQVMEHRAGFEPASNGFADRRVSLFATGALLTARIRAIQQRLNYFLAGSKVFVDKYQLFTFNPAPSSTLFCASACVAGAGTITSSPGCQFAGHDTAFASTVCSA